LTYVLGVHGHGRDVMDGSVRDLFGKRGGERDTGQGREGEGKGGKDIHVVLVVWDIVGCGIVD